MEPPDSVTLAERKLAGLCNLCGSSPHLSGFHAANTDIGVLHHDMCFWRLHTTRNSAYRLDKVYPMANAAVFRRKGKATGPHTITIY